VQIEGTDSTPNRAAIRSGEGIARAGHTLLLAAVLRNPYDIPLIAMQRVWPSVKAGITNTEDDFCVDFDDIPGAAVRHTPAT